MVRIEFLGPMARENLELDVKSLQELKSELLKDESLSDWLKMCAVAVNDTLVNKIDFKLKSGDKVTLLPPVCGG